MRPAVHASFLRNRGITQKRRKRTHVFSPRRLLFMVICGVVLFIPGLALTIVGLQNNESDYQDMDENHRIMYQAVGPAMGTLGIVVMFASCIYFNCYGTVPHQTPAQLNSQQQSFSEQDQEGKGSIRSKQREQSQQHQQLYSQKQQQLHNGGSVDVYTSDCENRLTIKEEDESGPNIKAPHRTSEEDVPLAKMEDTDILTKGLYLDPPLVAIHIQEPSDTEDIDVEEGFQGHKTVRWRVEA